MWKYVAHKPEGHGSAWSSMRAYNEMWNASHKAENTTIAILADADSQMGGKIYILEPERMPTSEWRG